MKIAVKTTVLASTLMFGIVSPLFAQVPAISDILKAVVQTAEPLQPIVWADPVQFTHGQLAAALFAGGLTDAVVEADRKLLYPAIRILSRNADGMARSTLRALFLPRTRVAMEAKAGPVRS